MPERRDRSCLHLWFSSDVSPHTLSLVLSSSPFFSWMISLFPVSPRAEFRVFVAGRRVSLLVISHPARNEQRARYVTASVLGGRGPGSMTRRPRRVFAWC